MRALAISAGIISLALFLSGWTFGPGAIDCKAKLDYTEARFCGSPQLVKQDFEVARRYKQVFGHLRGEDRTILKAGERYWKIKRFSCDDEPGKDLGAARA